jgi:Flp pilus assembly protein TadG
MAAVIRHSRLARYRSARGAELVEFALLFPLVLVAIVALIETGLLFTQYEALNNAAREGARLAAIPGWVKKDVEDRVAAYVGAAGMNPGLVKTDAVADTFALPGRAININIVRVTVEYPYSFSILAPVLQMAGGNVLLPVSLKAVTTMRTEVMAGF